MRREVEHGLQVAVARYLDLCLDPERTWWSAIDHGAGKMSKRSAGMMKARGVKRGLPDFIIMWAGHFMGIELKAPTGKLSPVQIAVGCAWLNFGFYVQMARSLEQVQAILLTHHVPLRHKMIMFGGGE